MALWGSGAKWWQRMGTPTSAFQKLFTAEKLSNLIRKRRSSNISEDKTSPLHETKRLKDLAETANENTSSDYETNNEIMNALDKINIIPIQNRQQYYHGALGITLKEENLLIGSDLTYTRFICCKNYIVR